MNNLDELDSHLVEDEPDSALFTLDSAGRVSSWDARAHSLTGHSEAEILGHPYAHLSVATTLESSLHADSLRLAERDGGLEQEELWVRSDGTTIWVSVFLSPLHDAAGRLSGFAVLVRSLLGPRQREAALLTRESLFQSALERAPVCLLVTDGSWALLESNPALAALLGYTAAELAGAPSSLVFPAEGQSSVHGHFERVTREGRAEGPLQLRTRTGETVRVQAHSVELPGNRVLSTLHDCTARHQAEEWLRTQEAKQRGFLEKAPLAMFVVNDQGRLVESNTAAQELLGYPAAEFAAMTVEDLVPPDQRPGARGGFSSLAETGLRHADIQLQRRDGQVIWVTLHAFRITPDLFMGFCQDITASRRAEERLQKQEAQYRALVETSVDGVWLCDLEGRILEVNDAYVRRSGYTRAELLDMRIEDLEAVDSPERIRQRIAEAASTGSLLFESGHRDRHGVVWPVEVTCSHWPSAEDRLFIFLRDITRRKHSDAVLRARLRISEQAGHLPVDDLMQVALNEAEALTGSSIGFFHFVDEDQEHLTLTAWSSNTLLNMCSAQGKGDHYPISQAGVWVDCVHARQPIVHNDYASLTHRKGMPQGHAPVHRELTVPIVQDGRVTAVIGVGNKHADYDDEDVRLVQELAGLAADIVARKRAESQLDQSRASYQHIVESANDGIWSLDDQHRTVFLNPAMCRMLGYREAELVGRPADFLIHEEDLPAYHGRTAERRAGRGGSYEIRLKPKHGTICICKVEATALLHPDGRYKGSFGLFTDITAIRQAEQALQESEHFARGVLNSLSALIAVLDRAGVILEVNDAWRNFASDNGGLDHPSLLVGANYLDGCLQACGDETQPQARLAFEGIQDVIHERAASFELEYGCNAPGQERWFLLRVLPLQGSHGSVVVAHENITERRRLENVQAFLVQSSGSGSGGVAFFRSLASFLADNLSVDHVSIDQLDPDGRTAHTLAAWGDGVFQEEFSYELKDTLCEQVVRDSLLCLPSGVAAHCPENPHLCSLGAESYLGIALTGHSQTPIGLIVLVGRRPLPNPRSAEAVLRLVAVRAAAELERLEAEAALRQRERLLNAAQRLSKVGGWEWDLGQETMTWTEETYRIHDLEPAHSSRLVDQFVSVSLRCYRPEDQPLVQEAFERCGRTGEAYDLELPFTSTLGTPKWVRTTAEAVWRDGRIVKVVGNLADVTERRKAEESYQSLFREMLDGFALHEIILDGAGRPIDYHFLAINPAFERMTGLQAEAIVGRTALEMLPGVEASWIEVYGRVALTGVPEYFENYSADLGKRFEVMAYRPAPGQFACVFADITQRWQSDLALQRRMELLALIAETSSRFLALPFEQLDEAVRETIGAVAGKVGVDRSYVFQLDSSGSAYNCTQEWCDAGIEPRFSRLQRIPRSGSLHWDGALTRGEFVQVTDLEELPRAELEERIWSSLAGTRSMLMLPLFWQGEMRGFVSFDTLHTARKWSAEEQHVLNAVANLISSALERRQRELALQESSERLSQALEAVELGSWSLDLATKELRLDPRASHHLGLTHNCYTQEDFLERVHPADRRKVESTLAQMVAECDDRSHSLEFRICLDELRVHWLATFSRVIRAGNAPDGRPVRIVGMVQNISARVQADQALKRSEARYRNLVETTYDLIWEVDAEGIYTYVSPKSLDILGRHAEEIIGHTPFDFMEPADSIRVQAEFQLILQQRRSFSGLINTAIHRDGHRVVLETSGTPILTQDGLLLGYRGVDRDVTARAEAERRTAMQATVSQVLAEAVVLEETAQRILETICRAEEFDFGALWNLNRLTDQFVPLAVWCGPEGSTDALAEQTRDSALAQGTDLPGRVWSTGGFLALNEDALRAASTRDALTRSGLNGALCVPIQHASEVIGALEVFSRSPLSVDPVQLDVLMGIGRQVGQYLVRHLAQEELRHVVSTSPSVSYILRRTSRGFVPSWVSENIQQVIGCQAQETQGNWWEEHIHPDDLPRVREAKHEMGDRDLQVIEHRLRHKDGHYLWVRDEKRLLRDETGQVKEVVGVWSDITERVKLEDQLRQSQKMEAVGQLAGGVAHDFNNLLTVINGYSEMLQSSMAVDDPNRALLVDIRDAGERAAALTRQLLAFSRKQVLQPRLINLGGVVRGLEKMLRRLLGEDVVLATILPPGQPSVRVDPGQIEQVVINLCVNARDAMPQGGRLVLETRQVRLTEQHYRLKPDHRPGEFVVLEVQDCGCGMGPELISRIFEPFFTTKELGKGTGLGLATVLGIIQQSNGFLDVSSEPGVGTTFRVYLPRAEEEGSARPGDELASIKRGGGERILLVEDEEAVRAVAQRILKGLGYQVQDFSSGEAALAWLRDSRERVDLLLSDVVMPQLGGPALAGKLRELDPGLRVLFMSGYTDDSMGRYGLDLEHVPFLNKPFAAAELARKVREVLDAPTG